MPNTRYLTPPQYAERLGVNHGKVLGCIRSGELPALNVATNLLGRPRWRISEADIAVFEQRRTSAPPPTKSRPRRKAVDVIEFF